MSCDVTRAYDGKDGLKEAVDNSYDLIVLDIMLPNIDGLEICKELRKQENYTPDPYAYSKVRRI